MPQPIDMKRYAQLKTAGELPSPRGVAIAIIRLTQASDVSLAEIGRVIKGDPAFVGRLIKAANGLVAENRRAVVSVQEALMVLGLPAVRTLALGFSLLSAYRKGAVRGLRLPALLVVLAADGAVDAGAGAARARGRG
jgi:response regulator receiver modulated diguanylate cyclase